MRDVKHIKRTALLAVITASSHDVDVSFVTRIRVFRFHSSGCKSDAFHRDDLDRARMCMLVRRTSLVETRPSLLRFPLARNASCRNDARRSRTHKQLRLNGRANFSFLQRTIEGSVWRRHSARNGARKTMIECRRSYDRIINHQTLTLYTASWHRVRLTIRFALWIEHTVFQTACRKH